MSRKADESVAESTSVRTSALVGRYDHALDPKKRLTIPSEWRELMGNPGYIYAMPDRRERCVNLIPMADMDVWLEKIRAQSLFDPAMNAVLQTIGQNSYLLSFDSQGRIRICDKLLQFANLTTTVAMVGSVKMIKVWDPAALSPADAVDQAALDAAMSALPF